MPGCFCKKKMKCLISQPVSHCLTKKSLKMVRLNVGTWPLKLTKSKPRLCRPSITDNLLDFSSEVHGFDHRPGWSLVRHYFFSPRSLWCLTYIVSRLLSLIQVGRLSVTCRDGSHSSSSYIDWLTSTLCFGLRTPACGKQWTRKEWLGQNW